MKDWFVVGMGFVLLGLIASVVFVSGRRYERKQFQRYLPVAMDGMCVDCNQIGYKDGYKKGLSTCDDVMDRLDDTDDGRR